MTNETVIAILGELKKCYLGEIVDALDFAIEAVKAQEPVKPMFRQGEIFCGRCGIAFPKDVEHYCPNCEYADEFNNAECETYLLRDALALLKRESIKPTVEHNPAGQPMWCCGNCGTTLFFKFPRQTDDEDERKHYRFCYYCGMAVKWE